MYWEAEGLLGNLYLFIEGIAQGHLNVLGGRRIVGECSGRQKDCR